MDPRHLVQLATILEKGSITQASRHLHLTQPTLTHNMQTLEMQAGGTLFERSRFGVRSTPLGEMLAREGRAITRRLKDAVEVSARHRSGLKHQVRLGTGPIVGAGLLPGLTRELLQRYPGIALTVQSDRPHLLVEQLVDGRYDLVIAPSWLDRPPPGIERFVLVKDDLGVFCGAAHALAAKRALGPGDADDQGWISLGTASPFDQDVREMLTSAGVGSSAPISPCWGRPSCCCASCPKGGTCPCCRTIPCACCSPISRWWNWHCLSSRSRATSTSGAGQRCWRTLPSCR